MPIFWRTLLAQYLKVLLLSSLSFVTLLLVSRLKEIAEIASLGAAWKIVFLFALYQIPTILPIALPLSAFISAMLLFQRLSETHELTAFRALGISLNEVLRPLLVAGAFLGLLNFYIASEISTATHLQTRKVAYELTSVNPLLLLQNAKMAKFKGAFLQLDPEKQGQSAKNLVVALANTPTNNLNLLLAKRVKLKNDDLVAENVTLVSSIPSKKNHGCDSLIIENQREAKSRAVEFANLLRKGNLRVANDHLKMGLLRARLKDYAKKEQSFFEKNVQKCYSEIMRRLSLAIAPFAFTLLGASFGIKISREGVKKGLFVAIALVALSLVAFFVGKACDHTFWLATLFFLTPSLVIVFSSLAMLKRVTKGIET